MDGARALSGWDGIHPLLDPAEKWCSSYHHGPDLNFSVIFVRLPKTPEVITNRCGGGDQVMLISMRPNVSLQSKD